MIKITFEFENAQAACAFISTLPDILPPSIVTGASVGAPEAAPTVAPAPAPQETVSDREAVAVPVAAVSVKRGRGRPAKVVAPQPVITLDEPKTAPPAAGVPAQERDSTRQPPAAAVPVISKVQDAIESVLAAKGTAYAMACLSRFGVKRSRELAEGQRADFIAYCADAVAGKLDPIAGSGTA